MNHVVDKVYFRVTFADPELSYPVIDAFIFLGTNLSDEDEGGDYYYFQNAVDLYSHGDARRSMAPGAPVSRLSGSDLMDDMLDVEGLVKALSRSVKVAR